MPSWGLVPVSPTGIAVALPERVVTNAELCEDLETTPEWIEEKTGIRERRFLGPDESIVDLAVAAAARALRAAGLQARDVDVLVVASSSPDFVFPAVSIAVAHELGMTCTRVVDLVQQACASSVYATWTAACLLQEPSLETALVVCAEAVSRICEPGDRATRIFFGDAAGAMVLRKASAGEGLLAYDLGHRYTDAVSMATPLLLARERAAEGKEQHDLFFHMDGRAVLREATTRLPASIRATLSFAGLTPADVDGLALHQASVKMVRHIARQLQLDDALVPATAAFLGNTAAASPLTALWRLVREGRAKRGAVVVVGAIGAGFMWGSLCFRLADELRVED